MHRCAAGDYYSTFSTKRRKRLLVVCCGLKRVYCGQAENDLPAKTVEIIAVTQRARQARKSQEHVRLAFLSRANNKRKRQNKETGQRSSHDHQGCWHWSRRCSRPVIRMAQPLPEPSDAPRAEGIAAESEIARVEKSLALVNADLNRRAEEAANGDEGAKRPLRFCRPSPCSLPIRRWPNPSRG